MGSTFAQGCANVVARGPSDEDRTVVRRRPPLPARARGHGRRRGVGAASRPLHSGPRVSPLQAFNASRAAAPGSRCLTCSRRPRSSHGGPEHPRRSWCCSCYLSPRPPSLASFRSPAARARAGEPLVTAFTVLLRAQQWRRSERRCLRALRGQWVHSRAAG